MGLGAVYGAVYGVVWCGARICMVLWHVLWWGVACLAHGVVDGVVVHVCCAKCVYGGVWCVVGVEWLGVVHGICLLWYVVWRKALCGMVCYGV